MNQDITWYGGRPRPRRLCVGWGPRSPPQKGWGPTQFSAHIYCGQTAAWIKMPLGTDVDLGLRDVVLDVDPATPRKNGHTHPHPIFGPCLLWPNSWTDEDVARYGSRPRLRPHCTRRGPSSSERGTTAPYFRPMSNCGHGHPSQPLLSYVQNGGGLRLVFLNFVTYSDRKGQEGQTASVYKIS